MDSRKTSYTAASAIPWKLFRRAGLLEKIIRGAIPPAHLQLIPTNRCNLSCSFCSCANRNMGDEFSFEEIGSIVRRFSRLGARAVTITGGGEPLLHDRINDIITLCRMFGLEVGLVSNGLEARRLDESALAALAWARFSCSDELPFERVESAIKDAVERGGMVDFAFSYVLTRAFNPDNLAKYIGAANLMEFTHVRVVSDLTDLDGIPGMDAVRDALRSRGVDDGKVIYQGRKDYEAGARQCWISLLKPVVSADGFLFPCCGAQYAEAEESLDLGLSMRMGQVADIERIWKEQKPFDGSRCVRCYYGAYNEALAAMRADIEHLEFI